MEKIHKILSQAITVLGILLFVTSSCESDDSDNTSNENLQGLWEITEIKYTPVNDTTATESQMKDTTISYPNEEGIIPYIRFTSSKYEKFQISTKDTSTEETGTYTLKENEISMLSGNGTTTTYGYTIEGKQLIMIKKTEDGEISHYAKKLTDDPFIDAETNNTENTDQDITSCLSLHDTENSILGSYLNPIIIDANREIQDTLHSFEGRNDFSARYYLEVIPNRAYRVKIIDLISEYDDIDIEFLKFTTINVAYKLETEKADYSTTLSSVGKSASGESLLEFDIFPTSSCLYLEIFSYQRNINFKFEIEDLSIVDN